MNLPLARLPAQGCVAALPDYARPCPDAPEAAAGRCLRGEDPEGKRQMKTIGRGTKIVAGAGLLAAAIYVILAFPGFVSDRDSTVPVHTLQETRR